MGEGILINCTYSVGNHDHPTFLKIPVKHKNLQVETSNYAVWNKRKPFKKKLCSVIVYKDELVYKTETDL